MQDKRRKNDEQKHQTNKTRAKQVKEINNILNRNLNHQEQDPFRSILFISFTLRTSSNAKTNIPSPPSDLEGLPEFTSGHDNMITRQTGSFVLHYTYNFSSFS